MLIRCEEIVDGPGPGEKLVTIRAADGTLEEAFVDSSFVREGLVDLPAVARRNGSVLVELPSEAASGAWRIWVSAEQAREPA
jgi:hypothetical protein